MVDSVPLKTQESKALSWGQIRFLKVHHEAQFLEKLQNEIAMLDSLQFGASQNYSIVQIENNPNTALPAVPGNCSCQNSKQSWGRTEAQWHGFELKNFSLELEPQKSAVTGCNIDMEISIR